MALADYKTCDLCGEKAFYDVNLGYQTEGEYRTQPFLEVGEPQFKDFDMHSKYGVSLGYLGDWAVLCDECSKTHRVAIVERAAPSPAKTEGEK